MCLDHDRASGRQRGGRIAACDREGQREVAGTEYRDGSQRHAALPNVGTRQREPIGLCGVDAGLIPAALPKHSGEQPQLASRCARPRRSAVPVADHSRRERARRGASPIDSRLAAMVSRNRALVSIGADRYPAKASAAAAQALSTCERSPYGYGGSRGFPVCGSRRGSPCRYPRTEVPAINICPDRSVVCTIDVIRARYDPYKYMSKSKYPLTDATGLH